MGATLTGLDPRLPENTLVYGVDGGEAARAYPLTRLRGRPLVNDRVGRTAVVLVPVGTIGVAAFERTVGRPRPHLRRLRRAGRGDDGCGNGEPLVRRRRGHRVVP